jgi:hypothetical protein
MKTAQYILMAMAFLFAGLSAMMFWGQGFHTWCWQIICMMWIFDSFLKQRRIDKLEQ